MGDKINMNNNIIDTSLEYKQHNDFFANFFIYHKTAHELITHCYANKKLLPATFQAISLLRSYASNYLPSDDEFKERLNKILSNINNPNSLNEMGIILKEMNLEFENSDILPKKQNIHKIEKDFWMKEENLILKQWKKAGLDILTR